MEIAVLPVLGGDPLSVAKTENEYESTDSLSSKWLMKSLADRGPEDCREKRFLTLASREKST